MFQKLRQLEISLAAKCQLLFGAAVVLIIAAALFVPWQRMDQLVEQIDERAALALAETTKAQHLLWASLPEAERRNTEIPSRMAGGATTMPVTAEGRFVPVPRMVPLWDSSLKLTAFEKRSIDHFRKRSTSPTRMEKFEAKDGAELVRFTLALRAEASCMTCHTAEIGRIPQAGAAAPQAAPTMAQTPPEDQGEPDQAAVGPTPPPSETLPILASTSGAPASQPASQPATLPATNPVTRPALPTTTQASTAPATAPAIPVTTLVGLVSMEMKTQVDANQLLLNRVFMLTAGLLAGTLAILVFFLITTKLILQPVRVLRETAEKVSKGDLNVRSHIFTGDEFQQLSETFNIMLANLKESEDQLRAINKSLDLKLGQLAESNLALYESNRLKSEFLANVSHELRTPLNSILGFAELLRDTLGAAAVPEQRTGRYLQNILTSGKNLLELINDLLDLAKIEAGRMEVRSAPLPLGDLFEGLTGILKPLCEKKGLEIVSGITSDVPILQTDAAKLQQVLYNFLSNAIKFSPTGGTIHLNAERADAAHVRISVSDPGPGIAPEKHAVIFEKFRQIDGSVTREHGGTGLGLAISKELVSLLGGTIGVQSTEGEGATFWIILPLKIEAGAADVRSRMVMA